MIQITFRLLIALCLALPAIAAVEDARAIAVDDGYLLSWQSDGPVNISVSSDPSMENAQFLAESVQGISATLNIPGHIVRPYFQISDGAEDVIVAERLLPLAGGRNFRDLGGYKTVEGKRVRWGKLYRSGKMDGLTDADYDYLSKLGIKVVCDLRSNEERAVEPTDWRTRPAARYRSWDNSAADGSSGSIGDLFAAGNIPSGAEVRQYMIDSYAGIAYEQAYKYEEIFNELASGEIPLAFNCSAGKDRAGLGAALILTALGVEREQIVHDYSLSETFVDYIAEYTDPAAQVQDGPYAFLAQLPLETLKPLFRSDPAYLEGAFAGIEKDHGSVMRFIRNELNVTEEELSVIRQRLLE